MRAAWLGVWALGAAVLLAACGPRVGENGTAEGELVPSLEVQLEGEAVRLSLRVRNAGTAARTLEFPTAQRYDFVVRDEAGAEVWRWSEDMMFAQVLGTEVLPPGGELRYEELWPAGGRTGRYEAEGVIPAMNHPIEARATIDLGRGGDG